jgi:hypothetical protein
LIVILEIIYQIPNQDRLVLYNHNNFMMFDIIDLLFMGFRFGRHIILFFMEFFVIYFILFVIRFISNADLINFIRYFISL